jgi:glycosyltransferase involved in cell wall biosynthesis
MRERRGRRDRSRGGGDEKRAGALSWRWCAGQKIARPLKILQVNASWQLGGAETVATQLLHGLRRVGHQSGLAVAYGKSYPRNLGLVPLYPRILSRMHHTRLHPMMERLFPRRTWTDASLRAIGDSPWDVIHVHNFHGDYAAIETLAELARRKPVVWTFHGCWGITGGCDHTGGCERYLTACGHCPQVGRWPFLPVDNTAAELERKVRHLGAATIRVVSPSAWLAQKIRGSKVGARWPVSVIPNGVDTARFSPRQEDPAARAALGLRPDLPVVLVVNRNFEDPTKGYPMARDALLGCRDIPMQVVLAGRNGATAAGGLRGVATVPLGYVADPARLADYYGVADILLFASPEENFPCTIVEAMAAECCVVSTPTSGVTEQIEHGRTGLLAGSMDGVALGGELREALGSPRRRRELGRAARLRAGGEFGETAMIARHLELYGDALRQRAA